MQTHVTRGYELLRCIGFLNGAAEIILAHHEHFDGAGYPHGIMGTEFRLEPEFLLWLTRLLP